MTIYRISTPLTFVLFFSLPNKIKFYENSPSVKKIVLIKIAALCLTFSCLAQSEQLTIKNLRLDSVTAIGKPNGDEVSEEIDKDGGRVFSADNKMELIIPEGALNKKRKIQIQSVINLVANGRGNAYKMEPSGLQFQKPVTLVYHYTDDELSGTSAEFKGIAWQDEKGKWSSIEQVTLDTAAKTITTQINHFSSYASFDKIVLLPRQARVKVEKSIQMEIHFVISDLEGEIALPPTIPVPQWSVNGVNGGNGFVGTITPLITNHAKYTAPVSMPDDNPVAVSAKIRGLEFRFNRQTFRDPSLVSHLLIYDKAYRVSMNFWVDNSADGMCTMRLEDRCEFTVLLEGTRSMIKEISNQNLSIRLNPCKCQAIWTNRSVVAGPLNPTGASRINVTPASLPSVPFRKVRIMLTHGAAPYPKFTFPCPARGGVPFVAGYAAYLPPMIEFEANNEMEQRFTLSELSRGSMRNDNRQGLVIVLKQIED